MPVNNYDIAVALNAAALFEQTPWSSLGGPSDTLQTAVGKNTDGSLELFALKADGRVWHIKQTGQWWGQWDDIGAVDWKSNYRH
jgi:hypothetical protein